MIQDPGKQQNTIERKRHQQISIHYGPWIRWRRGLSRLKPLSLMCLEKKTDTNLVHTPGTDGSRYCKLLHLNALMAVR